MWVSCSTKVFKDFTHGELKEALGITAWQFDQAKKEVISGGYGSAKPPKGKHFRLPTESVNTFVDFFVEIRQHCGCGIWNPNLETG